ncbi:hypothetical protein [Enterococcus italicus]|uniref:hypothetical protein n=1 Tax=Enterococcus italicus TaxID=246144 RepID=UPI002073E872|nr:hypothetical protein [Enterococcus italicus]
MKYYHLIISSLGLAFLQFCLKHIFHLSASATVNHLFIGLQGLLLVTYSLLMIGFVLVKPNKKTTKKPASSTNQPTSQTSNDERWLKAS